MVGLLFSFRRLGPRGRTLRIGGSRRRPKLARYSEEYEHGRLIRSKTRFYLAVAYCEREFEKHVQTS